MVDIKIKYMREDTPELIFNDNGNGIDLSIDYVYGVDSDFADSFMRGEKILIAKGTVLMFGLGVAMELPEGYFANVRPRSSMYKHFKAIQTNAVGLIDDSYNGDNDEWRVQVLFMEHSVIQRGDRMCQFTIEKAIPFNLNVVDSLGNKDRGGYGTSGK